MTRVPAKKKTSKASTTGPQFTISIADASAHLFAVRLELEHPHPDGQIFALPVWIPGSYMVREFARHIIEISAFSAAEKKPRPVALTKLDKTSWKAAPASGPLVLEYLVYAYDLSVRAAHLDAEHAFFNGSSVFLCPQGFESHAQTVRIKAPGGSAFAKWRVATALPAQKLDESGFGVYVAQDYDALIDHPVEIGTFQSLRFNACGTPHDMVITGRVPNLDTKRLVSDLKRICETQIRMFEPEKKRAPFARYAFLTMAVGEGYGGLEHRSSTALLCSRDELPRTHLTVQEEGYRSFLGLCSHEYFHSWNVKRIKPSVFVPYQLDRENYTHLLWIFEGFTSYYDDLVLARCKIFSEAQYFATLAKTIVDVARGVGRQRQSVAESSFDAWTKYYRQDENSPNAIVSYYRKGSLVALALDLRIRAATRGKRSLDDVMRYLWDQLGSSFYSGQQEGLGEEDFANAVEVATGVDVSREVAAWAYGTEDLPLTEVLEPFGIQLEWDRHVLSPSIGAKCAPDAIGCRLSHVYEGEAAHLAGLSANDVIVAIDQLRVTAPGLARVLRRYAPGQSVTVHAFRRDELVTVNLVLDAEPPSAARLLAPRANRLRSAWLKGND